MIVIFKGNEFIKYINGVHSIDEVNKYKTNPEYMLYDIDFIGDPNNSEFSLDENNNLKYTIKAELKQIKYGFMDRIKFLFTGEIPRNKGIQLCH